MAKKSRKKHSNSKRRSPKKCSTPILDKYTTPASLGLSSIGTSSSSTQENAQLRNSPERRKERSGRIARKRAKKRKVLRRSARIQSSESDANWETESEVSALEDASSRRLSWSRTDTVDSPKLFCENPERVRDAQYHVGTTLDEPVSPSIRRNVIVPFEKDAYEKEDELLHIDFPHSFEIEPDHGRDTDVETHEVEECPIFDSANVVKTYPSAGRRNKTMPIVKLNEECLIDTPSKNSYADMLWREFIKNNDISGLSRNSNDLSAVQKSDASSSGDEIMKFDDKVVEKGGMETHAKRWDMKQKKWMRINTYNISPQVNTPEENDREAGKKIRRKYVKRTIDDIAKDNVTNSENREALNPSTRYRVFEFPTNKEDYYGSFVKEKIVIPPPSKKPRIISVAIRRLVPRKNVTRM